MSIEEKQIDKNEILTKKLDKETESIENKDNDQGTKRLIIILEFIFIFISLFIYILFYNNYFFFKHKYFVLPPNIIPDFKMHVPVSVVITIFNKLRYLNRCLNSVQNQTFKNIEITCIDDGSTDGSPNFIIERMKKDKRIKLIKNFYNKALLISRIEAILASRGDYIMCLDADDYYYLDIIEKVYYNALLLKSDILEFRAQALKGKKILPSFFPCYRNHTDNKQILQILQKFHFTELNWVLWNKIIKKELYEKSYQIFYPFVADKKIINAEDLIIYGTILFNMKTFVCTNFLGYFYLWTASDNSKTEIYQRKDLNKIQLQYARNVISYFYSNRNNLSRVDFNQFLKISNNRNLHYILKTIDKTQKFNCDINVAGYQHYNYNDLGYCIINKY